MIQPGSLLPETDYVGYNEEFGILGGNLEEYYILDAYKKGYFPWHDVDGIPMWYHPNPRCVMPPEAVKTSKSMKQVIRKGKFEFRMNTNFQEVLHHCATIKRKEDAGTWLNENFARAYLKLHNRGICISAETWMDNRLVGGLYATKIGKVLFGESMFSIEKNASKFALIHLCDWALNEGIRLIDCQASSPHMFSMGAIEIPRDYFMKILKQYT